MMPNAMPFRRGPLLAVAWNGLILIKASSPSARRGTVAASHNDLPTGERGGALMRFYTQHHHYYCGIDLHARSMYVCILDPAGTIVVHKDLGAEPEAFLRVIAPYRDDLVVAVECIFTWYWLADLCAREGIAFVLGHALYMRAIHGGKVKTLRYARSARYSGWSAAHPE